MEIYLDNEIESQTEIKELMTIIENTKTNTYELLEIINIKFIFGSIYFFLCIV